MKKSYKVQAFAAITATVALAAASIHASGASATIAKASFAPMQVAECAAKDADNRQLFAIGNGETVLLVPRDSATLRQLRGPTTYHHPEIAGRIVGVELQQQCRAILYGGNGANWGHKVAPQTGGTNLPPNHVIGLKCECR